MKRFAVLLPAFLTLCSLCEPASAQVSKGFQILLNRGFQIQALSQDDCYLHLDTYSNANYTAIQWDNSPGQHSSRPDWMGPAPGYLWSRWAWDETQMPAQTSTPFDGSEVPFMPQLFALQLGDEWNLNDDTLRTRLVTWFNSVRSTFTNVILYHNNWGSQIGDSQLIDFYTRAQPDLLCFDTYPWQSVYDTTQPNNTGAPIPGPPTGWYGDLRRYREHARSAAVPLGVYRQTFHSVQDYDQHVFRDPSFSELRLNTFAAMAFNAKCITDFIYNTGAGSLFTKTFNGSGDSVISTNGLYYDMAEVNKRAQNFGKALVRLTAVTTEANAGFTSSILFIRGRDSGGSLTTVPVGFLPDPDDGNYTEWAFQRNDPYLTNNWTVVNKGTKNNGYPGDVIIAWFKVLDETFDGSSYSNEVYMMVVNGLTDTTGTAADCAQEIRLNFVNPPLALEMLNATNGNVEVQSLALTNGLRQLVLNLNGGDAALFKFSDGAPFVGAQVVGAPVFTLLPASLTNNLGSNATFTGRAAGAAPLNYRWQFNGAYISGATTNTYTLSNLQASNGGSYTLVASNASGVITSAVATLTVLSPPFINTQPQSQTLPSGTDAVFSVFATGSAPLSYQWRCNGTNIFGSTSSSYTRTNVQSRDTGIYSVIVSNNLGNTNSAGAVLTVNGAPSIITQPKTQGAVLGGIASFSVVAVGGGALSYQWSRDGVALTSATNSGLTLNSIQSSDLGLYSVSVGNAYGSTISQPAGLTLSSTLTIAAQPQSRSANAGTTVVFTVTATGAGLSYQWQRGGTNLVDGGNIFGANTDTLVLAGVTRYDATNYVVVVSNAAGSIASSPASLTVLYSLPLTESFNYTPGAFLANQVAPNLMTWADVGTNVGGPVITNVPGNLGIPGLAPAAGNSIRFGGIGKSSRLSFPGGKAISSGTVYFSFACKVSDLTGASSSGGFFAGFNNSIGSQGTTPTVVAPRVYLRTVGSSSTTYNLGIAKTSDNSAEWVFDGTGYLLNQTNFIVCSYTFNTGATNDDVVKMWVNPDPSTFGSASPPATTLVTSLGGDITANQIASFVFFQRSPALEPASIYTDELRIDTAWAGVTPPGAPFIGIQPQSRTNNQGTTATFVVVPSTTNVTYQWLRNGANLVNGGNVSGANSDTLLLSSVTTNEAANYEVIVSNVGGSAASAPATLTVDGPPQITFQPQSKSVSAGSPASFSVAAHGLPQLTYQWQFQGNNIANATSSTYLLAVAQRTNAGNYSVLVTNSSGSALSAAAALSIVPTHLVQLSSVILSGGGKIQLTGSGDPGYFTISGSSNLADWFDLTNIFGADGTFVFTDATTNGPLQFYRARLSP